MYLNNVGFSCLRLRAVHLAFDGDLVARQQYYLFSFFIYRRPYKCVSFVELQTGNSKRGRDHTYSAWKKRPRRKDECVLLRRFFTGRAPVLAPQVEVLAKNMSKFWLKAGWYLMRRAFEICRKASVPSVTLTEAKERRPKAKKHKRSKPVSKTRSTFPQP